MGKGGAIRYASTADMPPQVRAAAERALGSPPARRATPPLPVQQHRPYQPIATSSGAAPGKKASGRVRHRLGEMNGTEQAYALHLNEQLAKGEVLWWTFEAIRLRLADKTTLTIDFFVMTGAGELQAHELKGKDKHWEDDARVKIKVAAELYPFQFFGVHRASGAWQYEPF